ncbi:uncharacterized protein LAJ45_04075 [Morchella importuna]|nr:uncharacterized protein LAJ45_04075 [Morchella importuna]KAH8152081.1 hypothetical protein LAJ45_04075 [Morchella importuna]
MCNFKNTVFTCGCEIEENTSVCGWVNDDMSECMASSQSVDVRSSRTCGTKKCKNGGLALHPVKTVDLARSNSNSSSSGDEWADETPSPEL